MFFPKESYNIKSSAFIGIETGFWEKVFIHSAKTTVESFVHWIQCLLKAGIVDTPAKETPLLFVCLYDIYYNRTIF